MLKDEFFWWLVMKLFTVTKKLSAKLASETRFYMDFKPLTFGQWIKKTLYVEWKKVEVWKIVERLEYCVCCGVNFGCKCELWYLW